MNSVIQGCQKVLLLSLFAFPMMSRKLPKLLKIACYPMNMQKCFVRVCKIRSNRAMIFSEYLHCIKISLGLGRRCPRKYNQHQPTRNKYAWHNQYPPITKPGLNFIQDGWFAYVPG